MINLDTDDEEDAPRWAAPQPPARATLAAAEAREEAAREEAARAARCEADEERTAPRQMRVSTLPAPPVGWRLADQELRLMADGATTADKGLTKVLVQMRSGDAAPQDDEFGDTAGQHGGVWQLARNSICLWSGEDQVAEYLQELSSISNCDDDELPSVAFDIEFVPMASVGRPRPLGKGGGKVATLQFSHEVPLFGYHTHVIWLPGYETANVVHGNVCEAIEEVLDCLQVIGHNVKADVTRVAHDLQITPQPSISDSMILAGEIFGPRLPWNPRTKWGLAPLSEKLLGKPVAKDETLSNWESPLTTSQIVYAATDSFATLILYRYLVFLKRQQVHVQNVCQWNAKVAARARMVQQRTHFGAHVNDGTREGLLLARGSARLRKTTGDPLATTGNLQWIQFPSTNSLESLFRWDAREKCAFFFWDLDFADVDTDGPPVRNPLFLWTPAVELLAGLLEPEPADEPMAVACPFKRGICVIHGSRWFESNRSLFKAGGAVGGGASSGEEDDDDDEDRMRARASKRRKANKARQLANREMENKMKVDLEKLKNQPFADKEKPVARFMLLKWKREYKEGDVAKAFGSSWIVAHASLCRASLNATGGLPNDNNGLESINAVQKIDVNFGRKGVHAFTAQFPQWLSDRSAEDLSMAASMDYSNVSVDTWNTDFFKEAVAQYQAFAEKKGFFSVRFLRMVDGLQVMDIPSRRIVTLLTEEYPPSQRIKKDDPLALKLALAHVHPCRATSCSECSDSWHSQYVALSQPGSDMPSDISGLDFDLYIDLATCFHTLTPMLCKQRTLTLARRLTKSKMVLDFAKLGQVQGSPDADGWPELTLDETSMKQTGFVLCNCGPFLHTNWCIHVCVDGMVKGLIKKLPPVFRCEVITSWRTGRINNASAGGARGFG